MRNDSLISDTIKKKSLIDEIKKFADTIDSRVS